MGNNLVTGGLGFIGSRVAKRLIEDGENVVLFDIVGSSKYIADLDENRIKIVRGDLSNVIQVIETVKNNNIDCIYHLGALLSPGAVSSPQVAYTVNVNGTINILEAARLYNVECVMYPSTIATYGPGLPDIVNEDVVQYPREMYGATKTICERMGELYHYDYGVNFRSVRFPAIVGHERTSGLSAFTSFMIIEAAKGRPYSAYVDESTIVPFMYKDDAVNSLVSLRYANEANLKRRIYNPEAISCSAGELAAAIKKILPDAKIMFEPDADKVKMISAWAKGFDGTRARQEWDFSLQYNLESTIKSVIHAARQENGL